MMEHMPADAMGGMTADMMANMPADAMGGMDADMMELCQLTLWAAWTQE